MSYNAQWPAGPGHAAFGNTGATRPVGPGGPTSAQAASGSVPAGSQQSGEAAETRPPAAVPLVDIVESADELVVRLDAPGFEKDQIQIHADGSNLYVTADRTPTSDADPDGGERVLLTERPVRLERRISLPAHIDPEEASATHENGVCNIVVQKDEDDRRHEIGFQ